MKLKVTRKGKEKIIDNVSSYETFKGRLIVHCESDKTIYGFKQDETLTVVEINE